MQPSVSIIVHQIVLIWLSDGKQQVRGYEDSLKKQMSQIMPCVTPFEKHFLNILTPLKTF